MCLTLESSISSPCPAGQMCAHKREEIPENPKNLGHQSSSWDLMSGFWLEWPPNKSQPDRGGINDTQVYSLQFPVAVGTSAAVQISAVMRDICPKYSNIA